MFLNLREQDSIKMVLDLCKSFLKDDSDVITFSFVHNKQYGVSPERVLKGLSKDIQFKASLEDDVISVRLR